MVLASASPRRRELLARICRDFVVQPSDVPEVLQGDPREAAPRLAAMKARAVAGRLAAGVVLAADTVVVVDGDTLGKPAGAAEAARMLRLLRGRSHEVVTGLAVVEVGGGRELSDTVVSRVVIARYPDALVDAYVASGAPLDKAGAYAIQDLDGALVDAVVGSYTNVIGLPLGATRRLLMAAGVEVIAGSGT